MTTPHAVLIFLCIIPCIGLAAVASDNCLWAIRLDIQDSVYDRPDARSKIESLDSFLEANDILWLPDEASTIESEVELQLLGLSTNNTEDRFEPTIRITQIVISVGDESMVVSTRTDGVLVTLEIPLRKEQIRSEVWQKYFEMIGVMVCTD